MTDQELRDKLASEYIGAGQVVDPIEIYAFKAGWNSARANDPERAQVIAHLHQQYRFRLNSLEQELSSCQETLGNKTKEWASSFEEVSRLKRANEVMMVALACYWHSQEPVAKEALEKAIKIEKGEL